MAELGSVLVVGAGPGLGAALGRRFAQAGHPVVLASRHPEKLAGVVRAIAASGGAASAHNCDATDETAVTGLLGVVEQDVAPLDVVIYNAAAMLRQSALAIAPADYERIWRICAFGGFLVAREAIRRMLPRQGGTLLFTGATASLRGGANFAAFAGAKFALRALAQSLAREYGPQGIHVGHVVIDGQIGQDARGAKLNPDAIAEAYYALHRQLPSAWTLELDLRPAVEKF